MILFYRYTDIVSVVQAIENHPDPEVRSLCAIGKSSYPLVECCLGHINSLSLVQCGHLYTACNLPVLCVCYYHWIHHMFLSL